MKNKGEREASNLEEKEVKLPGAELQNIEYHSVKTGRDSILGRTMKLITLRQQITEEGIDSVASKLLDRDPFVCGIRERRP